jgi:hypothetical protein
LSASLAAAIPASALSITLGLATLPVLVCSALLVNNIARSTHAAALKEVHLWV